MGLFSKSTTYDPLSAFTPEQLQSVQALMSLASTGSGGGINLGQAYGGALGNYQQTGGELQALSQLQGLFGGQDIANARNTFTDLADTKFDPSDPKSGYAAFSRSLAKAGAESQDVINREAARTGGAFGSGRGRDTADLAENLANQRGSFLADLYQRGRQQQLAGAQGLQGLVGVQARLSEQLAQQSAVERMLKDKQAKDQYSDFLRTQQENFARIGLMQDQMNNPLGKITKKGPSTFGALLGEVSPLFGSYNTHKYGYTTNQSSISDATQALLKMFSGGGFGGSSGSGSVPYANASVYDPYPGLTSLLSKYN